jgi:hypothetical protein
VNHADAPRRREHTVPADPDSDEEAAHATVRAPYRAQQANPARGPLLPVSASENAPGFSAAA